MVGGATEIEADGSTVGAVLTAVAAEHPGFGPVVFERDGSLKRYLAVFVGDQDCRHMRGLETRVGVDAEIVLLPAASGGSR